VLYNQYTIWYLWGFKCATLLCSVSRTFARQYYTFALGRAGWLLI